MRRSAAIGRAASCSCPFSFGSWPASSVGELPEHRFCIVDGRRYGGSPVLYRDPAWFSRESRLVRARVTHCS